MAYSFSCAYLMCLRCRSPSTAGQRQTHHGDEQIGDARTAHLAKCFELIAINAIKQQNASTENRAFLHRFESTCGSEVFGIHHHFNIPRVEFFHAALEDDPATVDEHEVRQNVLDLFHLMRGHYDGAAAIEIVVKQRIVKLLPKQNVEAKCWLIEHEQARVDCHHDCEMELRYHS